MDLKFMVAGWDDDLALCPPSSTPTPTPTPTQTQTQTTQHHSLFARYSAPNNTTTTTQAPCVGTTTTTTANDSAQVANNNNNSNANGDSVDRLPGIGELIPEWEAIRFSTVLQLARQHQPQQQVDAPLPGPGKRQRENPTNQPFQSPNKNMPSLDVLSESALKKCRISEPTQLANKPQGEATTINKFLMEKIALNANPPKDMPKSTPFLPFPSQQSQQTNNDNAEANLWDALPPSKRPGTLNPHTYAQHIKSLTTSTTSPNLPTTSPSTATSTTAPLNSLSSQSLFSLYSASASGNWRCVILPEKRFQCSIEKCGMTFPTSSELTCHVRTHTGEKPYKCEYEGCGKAFAQSGGLVRHRRTHTGDRPYQCKYADCNKSFAESGHLTRHIRSHTGERPFVCVVNNCGKHFATSYHLNRHQKTHNSKKNFIPHEVVQYASAIKRQQDANKTETNVVDEHSCSDDDDEDDDADDDGAFGNTEEFAEPLRNIEQIGNHTQHHDPISPTRIPGQVSRNRRSEDSETSTSTTTKEYSSRLTLPANLGKSALGDLLGPELPPASSIPERTLQTPAPPRLPVLQTKGHMRRSGSSSGGGNDNNFDSAHGRGVNGSSRANRDSDDTHWAAVALLQGKLENGSKDT